MKFRSRPFVRRCFLFLLPVAFACARPAAAQSQPAALKLTLNPAQTVIHYTLSDILHTVHGTFTLTSGWVVFSPSTGAARGDIVINAASGNSGSHMRDSRMRKDILQVPLYPVVEFLPRKVIGAVPTRGAGNFQVAGICKIHGGEHPLTLDFQGTVTGGAFTGTTRFAIPYVQWGLKNPSTLFLRVQKQVQMSVTAVGTLAPVSAQKPSAAHP